MPTAAISPNMTQKRPLTMAWGSEAKMPPNLPACPQVHGQGRLPSCRYEGLGKDEGIDGYWSSLLRKLLTPIEWLGSSLLPGIIV